MAEMTVSHTVSNHSTTCWRPRWNQQNHIICRKQGCYSVVPKQKPSSPQLHLETLSMNITRGLETGSPSTGKVLHLVPRAQTQFLLRLYKAHNSRPRTPYSFMHSTGAARVLWVLLSSCLELPPSGDWVVWFALKCSTPFLKMITPTFATPQALSQESHPNWASYNLLNYFGDHCQCIYKVFRLCSTEDGLVV